MVEPDPVLIGLLAEKAGADGITVHLREDRRHIQDEDVRRLRVCMATRINLEMAATEAMVALALDIKPDSVCLVPENREEISTEGGLDVVARVLEGGGGRCGHDRVGYRDEPLHRSGPEPRWKKPRVEGALDRVAHRFVRQCAGDERALEFERLVPDGGTRGIARLDHKRGSWNQLCEYRGDHGIPHLHELNIGHSIISRSLLLRDR